MIQDYILVKDSNGVLHKWSIEEYNEQNNTYQVFAYGYGLITSLYKDQVYESEGKLYSNEIRDVKFNNSNLGFASFAQIKVD